MSGRRCLESPAPSIMLPSPPPPSGPPRTAFPTQGLCPPPQLWEPLVTNLGPSQTIAYRPENKGTKPPRLETIADTFS